MSWLVSRVAGMPPKMVPPKPISSGGENLGIGAHFYEALRLRRKQCTRIGDLGPLAF